MLYSLSSSRRGDGGYPRIKPKSHPLYFYSLIIILSCIFSIEGLAEPMQAGEAYHTRFSGTADVGGAAVIDNAGVVGSIIDLRSPSQAPRGQHWINEPQRQPLTAAEVGQVFGIALDDAGPNVYLTATSAFGLHRPERSRECGRFRKLLSRYGC